MKRDLSFQQVSNSGKLSSLSVIIVMIIIIIIIIIIMMMMMMMIIVITMFFYVRISSLKALTPTTSIFNSK